MNGVDKFLNVNNAHLRVTSGNVHASAFNLDQISIVTSSNTASTVNFNNTTKAFNAASNIEVGTANLFVDTTTSNVGIGTNAPQDTLHINGGTRIAGHILPTVNDTYDIGSAEYKIRHLFLGNSSLWLGDETRITFTGGKMKFRRRKKNALPRGLVAIAAAQGHSNEQETTAAALAHAGVSTVEEMKLEHWIDYTKTLDETKEINDIFTEDAADYEATTASEAFKEIGDDIFSPHNVSIGKTTAPTSALDVNGTVKATAFEGDGSALTGIVAGQWTESSGDIQRSSGNVGIGKAPDSGKKLDVNGTVKATAFEGDGSALTGITSGQWTESSGNIYRSSGKVGVGTSNPYVPLHVVGYSGSLSAAYCIYAKGNDAYSSRQFHLQTSMGWNNLSVYASDDIVTGQYLVSHLGTLSSSDERIKENIVDVDDASALELFRLLKPKKYQYIDKIKRGDDTVFGFIAQDVEKTLPHGTRKVEETIPNIMEIGTVTETNIITFSNFNTSNLQSNIHTLELTDKNANPVLVTVKEIIDEHSIRVDKDLSELLYEFDENGNDITEIVTITEPEYNTLEDTSGYVYDEINKVYTKILSNKIYVYGERIDNFLKVNKDTIWTVSTAALQEVDRQQQADKVRITELETQLASVLARLEALESA